MRHICFIIHQYANPVQPYAMNFVQSLAWKMRDMGNKITVISPLAVNIIPRYANVPYHILETTPNGNTIDVYFPKTIGLGQSHYILGKSLVGITVYFFEKAAEKVLKSIKEKPDILYGHFLAPSGVVVARLGKKWDIPTFFACGEAHDTIGQYGEEKARKDLQNVSGIIAVSTELKRYLTEDHHVISPEKVIVLPNGYDAKRFKKIDKEVARRKLDLPQDSVIISYVGAFNERKGILRVCEACNRVNGVGLICAGLEDQKPYGKNLLLATHLQPDEVPMFYYASDFFVLPTLAEGCCNAIVEAIACGLPVISSDLPFNDDILDDSYSIRINPHNVDDISTAIQTLAYNGELREKMSIEAHKKAQGLTLDARTKHILDFMDKKEKV